MSGVDLSYLLAVGDEFQCQMQMLETKEDRAQYKVKIGWVGRNSVTQDVRPELAAVHNIMSRWVLKSEPGSLQYYSTLPLNVPSFQTRL